jgi:hypothetical protein
VNVILISPLENLVEKVAEHLVGTEKDYSSNLVIFPGKRPSHFLRKVLADKEKSSFIPPFILSIDEFKIKPGLAGHQAGPAKLKCLYQVLPV